MEGQTFLNHRLQNETPCQLFPQLNAATGLICLFSTKMFMLMSEKDLVQPLMIVQFEVSLPLCNGFQKQHTISVKNLPFL